MNRFPGLCGIQDSNLVSARHRVYSPARLSNSGATACVDPAGIEPAPTGFHPVALPMSQRSLLLLPEGSNLDSPIQSRQSCH
jgi:hypothetical protein